MPGQHDDPVVLTTCRTEFEATLIAETLRAAGIMAQTAGGHTGGMRAEAPSTVNVLVRRDDEQRAREVLDENREDSVDIDWSDVDVGEPEDE